MPNPSLLSTKTKSLVQALARKGEKLVLAESCTGGFLASLFTEIPGASDVFCGSFVAYREDSKTKWIGVSPAALKRSTAVSRAISVAMVEGALKKTPESTIAASITGYIGPSGKEVGLVYFSILRRGKKSAKTICLKMKPVRGTPARARVKRRGIAAQALLESLALEVRANSEST